MFVFAKGQGARDEREKQAAERLKSLEGRADTHSAVAAELSTRVALTAQSLGALQQQFVDGFAGVTRQLEHIGKDVSNLLSGKTPTRRRSAADERAD